MTIVCRGVYEQCRNNASSNSRPLIQISKCDILGRVPPALIYARGGLVTRPPRVRRNRTLSQTSPGTASGESPACRRRPSPHRRRSRTLLRFYVLIRQFAKTYGAGIEISLDRCLRNVEGFESFNFIFLCFDETGKFPDS